MSEIYDRIAFAGVGKYNEFDQLRIAGVRHADLKGFSYSREDVDARSLANAYAQMLGQIFTHEMKPMEVEILVAEVGASSAEDQVFHILYDGSVVDEDRYSVIGGDAEAIGSRLEEAFQPGLDLGGAVRAAVGGAGRPGPHADRRPSSRSPCCRAATGAGRSAASRTRNSPRSCDAGGGSVPRSCDAEGDRWACCSSRASRSGTPRGRGGRRPRRAST